MNEALARNLSAKDLAKFAEQELDNLQLVLATPPAALAELVTRVDVLSAKGDQLDALLDSYKFDEVTNLEDHLDQVKNLADKMGVKDLSELERELDTLKETMTEFDMADAYDLCHELKRLKKLAQRIEDACHEASIAV
jgi:multidrug resistance efflux pump